MWPLIAGLGMKIADYAVSSSGGRKAQQRAQKYTERNMAQAQQYTIDNYKMQYQGALDQWNRENAYNTPQAQMQRNVDAGLNPNLVAGAGGVQNTSGNMGSASVSPSPAPSGASGQQPQLNLDPISAGRLQNETMLARSQAQLNQANANQLNSLAGKNDVEAATIRSVLPYAAQRVDADIRDALSRAGYNDAQTTIVPSLILLNESRSHAEWSRGLLQDQQAIKAFHEICVMYENLRLGKYNAQTGRMNALTGAAGQALAREQYEDYGRDAGTANALDALYNAQSKGPDAFTKELLRQGLVNDSPNAQALQSLSTAIRILKAR